jgi:hypothetical protein
MEKPCGTPCNECPWRRESLPGWLGPHDAEEWINLVHGDGQVACHKTIVVSDDPTGTTTCSGSAIYRRNVAKSPRGVPADHQLDADTVNVFARPDQFTDHHDRKQKVALHEMADVFLADGPPDFSKMPPC